MNGPPAIANIIIIAFTVYISFTGFTNTSVLRQYLFSSQAIIQGRQYYRLVTSGFLHADWMHLLFNMYSLYSFGSAVETEFGIRTFLAIYFAGIIGGDLFALFMHRREDYYALGASGGVCGVIFASIFLLPRSSVQLLGIPIDIPAYAYAIGFMLFSYYGIHTQLGNIGHDAHLGGSIIGLIMATILDPWIVPENPILYPAVMGLAIVILILLYLKQSGRLSRNSARHRFEEDNYDDR